MVLQQDVSDLKENQYVKEYMDRSEARKALRGRGLYDGPMTTGQGSYSLGKLWRKSGLGKSLAGAGRQVISALGNRAAGFIGSGAYVDNQLIAGGRMAPSGAFANDETDSIVLTDCEYVRDIYAPTIASNTTSGFNTQSISINPGLSDFAPHLSQIACNYSEYKILQCVVELRPQISESTVNNGMTGMAMVATQYALRDNSDSYFTNKEMIMQYHGSVSGRITDHIRAGVECDPSKIRENDYIVRTTGLASDESLSDFDHGMITIATNNIPSEFSNKAIYEMWVYYTVELRQRKSGALCCINQQVDQFVCSGSFAVLSSSGTSHTATAFVTGQQGVMYMSRNSLGGMIELATATGDNRDTFWKYTFPAHKNGRFEIKLLIEGTSLGSHDTNSLTTTGQIRTIKDIYGVPNGVDGSGSSSDTPYYWNFVYSTTGVIAIAHVDVNSAVAGTANSITLNVKFATGSTITQWALHVAEINNVFSQSYSTVVPEWTNSTDGVVYIP